ncbi:hypothetical protein [Streptomyces sp. NPDC056255]|uniref:hypothetical protein n=1 Tax=Streptomyces sp. NPDC056255 TaxID=3345764 RepID=UPI0035D9D398
MPQNHGRKTDLNAIKRATGVKHQDAIMLRGLEDPQQRAAAIRLLAANEVVSAQEAVAGSALLCEGCGWVVANECRECNGCGCTTGGCHNWVERDDDSVR